jgi:hypothetical protein
VGISDCCVFEEIQSIWEIPVEREGNKWVGICLELGTSTYSRTLKQCQLELEELVVDHLNVLEEIGERERFFEEWDITVHPTQTVPSQFTVRGSGEHWERLFQETIGRSGPFLRPKVFPVPFSGRTDLELAEV